MGRDVSDLFTFDEFLTHWASERPDRVAMREEDRVYSYAELDDLTARAASALIAAGLKKGDRIAWIGKNSDLYFTLFYGAARAGIARRSAKPSPASAAAALTAPVARSPQAGSRARRLASKARLLSAVGVSGSI